MIGSNTENGPRNIRTQMNSILTIACTDDNDLVVQALKNCRCEIYFVFGGQSIFNRNTNFCSHNQVAINVVLDHNQILKVINNMVEDIGSLIKYLKSSVPVIGRKYFNGLIVKK